ncbi:MAG: 23S rRNA (adenine(2503)-C(2))-methyltransferase RlmN [Deltaproteobacteria bacterium]|nr:23S rRNA (adenine(2503)-C(2))-methyltransferase RlmN [Deltaproteobacteria bacterium]
MEPLDLYGATRAQLAEHLDRVGVGAHHAARVARGLHRQGIALEAIRDLGPRHARAIRDSTTSPELRLAQVLPTEDGTTKLVIALADGARVEAVIIPGGKERATLCLSSQVGCAMGCTFCATATMGLVRGLSPGEIVRQLHLARPIAAAAGRRITRVVFMGMGEPLHHYAATRDAIAVLTDMNGVALARDSVTVSTVGLPARIDQLGRDFGGQVQLALSLHSARQPTRERLIPTAARHDVASLRAALDRYPRRGRAFIMLEVVVIPGLTDTPDELAAIAAFASGLPAIVNLIPWNPFGGASFRAPTSGEFVEARRRLDALGVRVRLRLPRGREVAAACGQLALATAG